MSSSASHPANFMGKIIGALLFTTQGDLVKEWLMNK
jgi:hypothetical protein